MAGKRTKKRTFPRAALWLLGLAVVLALVLLPEKRPGQDLPDSSPVSSAVAEPEGPEVHCLPPITSVSGHQPLPVVLPEPPAESGRTVTELPPPPEKMPELPSGPPRKKRRSCPSGPPRKKRRSPRLPLHRTAVPLSPNLIPCTFRASLFWGTPALRV